MRDLSRTYDGDYILVRDNSGKGATPERPLNLEANPRVRIEMGGGGSVGEPAGPIEEPGVAREGFEAMWPDHDACPQRATDRTIPMFRLAGFRWTGWRRFPSDVPCR